MMLNGSHLPVVFPYHRPFAAQFICCSCVPNFLHLSPAHARARFAAMTLVALTPLRRGNYADQFAIAWK